jgi:hypothetical protein
MPSSLAHLGNAPAQFIAKPRWPWYIVALGYFLPCVIGLGVWFHLKSIGRPVMSSEWIIGSIPYFAILSCYWVFPFVIVALLAVRVPLSETKYRALVFGAFLGAALGEIIIFGDAWTNVEAIALAYLDLPIPVCVATGLGALIGLAIGRLVEKLGHTTS